MSNACSLSEARAALGDRVIGPSDVASALGSAVEAADSVPFSGAELAAAAKAGEMLIYRVGESGGDRFTIKALIERFPKCFDPKFLETSGYQLKNEWGIALEPLAAADTCVNGWALVQPEILKASVNLVHDEQEPAVRAYEAQFGVEPKSRRRRTAIEAVFDTVIIHAVRGSRVLAKSWDWTSTKTLDGGLLHIGGFGDNGMQILGFSAGIRHGALGLCPTAQPNA